MSFSMLYFHWNINKVSSVYINYHFDGHLFNSHHSLFSLFSYPNSIRVSIYIIWSVSNGLWRFAKEGKYLQGIFWERLSESLKFPSFGDWWQFSHHYHPPFRQKLIQHHSNSMEMFHYSGKFFLEGGFRLKAPINRVIEWK